MKPTNGAIVFDNRAHHLPMALFLGLLAAIETWLDNAQDAPVMGLQFHTGDRTAQYTVNYHVRDGIPPKSVGWQSDYRDWELYIPEDEMRGIILYCRDLANTELGDDTVAFIMDEHGKTVMLTSSQVFHAPHEYHPTSGKVVQ